MGFLVVLLIIFAFWLIRSKKKIKSQLAKNIKELQEKNEMEQSLNRKISMLNERIKELEEKVIGLSKYEGVLDTENLASAMLEKAKIEVSQLKSRYEFILSVASLEAKKITEEAKLTKKKTNEEISELKKKYENILSEATIEAGRIIDNAKVRAEEIAGEAYKALNNTRDLEKTAQAMKNIIEGYGNRYIVSSYGLLDELAEDFGYTEAGEELKKARERSRMMVKNGTAAKCDYVEHIRRDTAIHFIIDAFNGKVDSILSTIKHDNYGTLEQKIKDSFYVVNNLGQAFRNAAITEEYLLSRLEELKWGVLVIELRNKEREEQRLIKEQMREEEKARKEYERAMKEAAKEEETLRRLMEKAQKQLAEATEQQRAKFEQQLNELQEKLKIAEEKNQRAISMAQQTKSGHVYIISNIGSFGENVFKIGMTRRLEPEDRVKELSDASVPFSFDIHAMIFSEDAPKLEYELHKAFIKKQMNKINPRKEFFKVGIKEIKELLDSKGINAKWTMTAEAREYKESLAIENALNNNMINEQDWIKNQLDNEYDDENELVG